MATTGSNSNTSGANVANVGFWPKLILPAILTLLGTVVGSIKGLISGALIAAGVDFALRSGSDKISDAVMEEICRRLIVTFEKEQQGNVLFQPTAPDDHTKAWWQTDAVTGLPIGRLKQWNEETQTWVDVDTTGDTYTPPLKRFGRLTSPAGRSTQNLPFDDIKTEDYKVTLTPTTFTGGAWLPAPDNFPTTFGYVIVNKTNTLLSVSFFGVPVGGIVWEVDIEDRQTTAD